LAAAESGVAAMDDGLPGGEVTAVAAAAELRRGITVRVLGLELQAMKRSRADLLAGYRPATGHEIRSRSFGQLSAPRNFHATSWQQRRGTLEDQAIFGPLRDFECACEKYRDPKHQNMVCDRCGVKVTTRSARRRRFGHIELSVPIAHPYGGSLNSLDVFPVLPAAFRESPDGKDLIDVYDRLARSNLSGSEAAIKEDISQLVGLLFPVLGIADSWGLQEAELIAFGMGLKSGVILVHEVCHHCGYPLEGLKAMFCPGCGNPRG
jgi:hypothetical protein